MENIWTGIWKIFGQGYGKYLDRDMENIWTGIWKIQNFVLVQDQVEDKIHLSKLQFTCQKKKKKIK